MIKLENNEVVGLEHAIRGMRNPMNSWEKSDSLFYDEDGNLCRMGQGKNLSLDEIGDSDYKLMIKLRNYGTDDLKFLGMIKLYIDINCKLYF